MRRTELIMEEVLEERKRQVLKWGTEKDLTYTGFDWYEILSDYIAWSRRMLAMGSYEKGRRRLIQVAALATAAVEALDSVHKAQAINTELRKVNDY